MKITVTYLQDTQIFMRKRGKQKEMQKFKTKVLSFLLTLCMLTGMLQPMAVEAAEATALGQDAVKAVTVSDTSEGSATIANIFDGEPTTYWTSTSTANSAYLTVELNDTYNLAQVDYTPRWYGGADNPVYWECTGNIKKLVVEVSADGNGWTTVTEDGGLDISSKIGRYNDRTLFPVEVEFEETAPINEENVNKLAKFVHTFCEKEE